MFIEQDLENIPYGSPYQSMSNIKFSCSGIYNILDNSRVNKAPDQHQIPFRILKDYSVEITPILQLIFNISFHKGELPDGWQTAGMCAIFKNKAEGY